MRRGEGVQRLLVRGLPAVLHLRIEPDGCAGQQVGQWDQAGRHDWGRRGLRYVGIGVGGGLQRLGGILDPGGVQGELDGGGQPRLVRVARAALGERVEQVQGGDAAVLHHQTDRAGRPGGEQLDDMAAQRHGARLVHALLRVVSAGGEVQRQARQVQWIAGAQHRVGLQLAGGADTLQGCGGAGQQQAETAIGVGQGLQRLHALADDSRGGLGAVIGQHVPRRQADHLHVRPHGAGQRGDALQARGAAQDRDDRAGAASVPVGARLRQQVQRECGLRGCAARRWRLG